MEPRVEGTNQNVDFFKAEPKFELPKIEIQPLPVADKSLLLRQNNLGAETRKLSLFAKFAGFNNQISPQLTPTAPVASPVDRNKVDDAVKAIKESLSQGITDWDVSHNDLENIENQFRDLNPAEVNAVYERLSSDDVENWIQELNGVAGDYDQGEKQRLFDTLAAKLNGGNLANFAEKLGLGGETYEIRPGQVPDGDTVMLGRAIANHAPDSVKTEFINELKSKAAKNQDAAVALADVLGSMKNSPDLLKETLRNLSDDELKAIVDGASRKTIARHGVENYDPEPLANLMHAVSTLQGTGAAEIKAKLFNLGAGKIKEIQDNVKQFGVYYGGGAEMTIRRGLTALIDSDTTGVVNNLEMANNGESLKTYVKSMIGTGSKADQEILGGQIARLLRGNDLSEDQLTRFEETIPGSRNGSRYFANAKSLGFYAGAIHSATANIKDDRGAQANVIKNIFGTAAGLIGVSNAVAGTLANGLTNQVVDSIVKKMEDEGYLFQNALIDATFPRDDFGKPYIGEAKTEWEASFAATAARYAN